MTDIFPESREEEILVSTINGEEYDKAPESRIEALLLELKEVIEEGGGGGGTTNYNLLSNKPSINSVTLTGDKSSSDLGIPTDADLAGKQDVLPVTASGNDVAFNGDIIDGQGNTLSVLAEALTKTASGNPVVITDCAGGKARSLKTTINAIQDLHGLPFPYVGGAYKNKLPMTVEGIKSANQSGTWDGNVYTHIYGVQFTILTDNDNNVIGIKLNGTPTDNIIVDLGNTNFYANKTYILNGAVENDVSARLAVMGIGSDYGDSFPYTPTADDLNRRVIIYITGRSAINNLIFHPMIRLATESDASFAPYSNICPIYGRTEATITVEGE